MGGFEVNHARATLLSLGAVNINGVPVAGQVSTWFDLDTIEGSANFTFDGSTLALAGSLAVSGVGPHAISGAVFGAVQLLIGDTFTSDGSSTLLAGIFHTPTLIGAPGDTTSLSGVTFTASLTTQTAVESIADVAQIIINEPFITDNLTGLITRASTVLITGAPDEGVDNYALRINSGLASLQGGIETEAFAAFGTSPSVSGDLRFRQGFLVSARDNANTGDLRLFEFFQADDLTIAPDSTVVQMLPDLLLGVGASGATGTLRLPNAGSITWRNANDNGDLNILSSPGSDTFDFGDTAMPELRINADGVEVFNLIVRGQTQGEGTQITRAAVAVATPSGATATATNLIPNGAIVLGVTTRVITAVTGPAGFDVGDGVDVDRWGNSLATGLNQTSASVDFTSSTLQIFTAANDVVITSDGVDFTGGSIRVIVHYITLSAPSS